MEEKGSSNGEYARLLSTIQGIREQAGGVLEIPQICVLGDQGSGKSSWLSSIVPGLRGVLPTGRGTVTRCPTVVRVRPGQSEEVFIGSAKRKFSTCSPDGKRGAKDALLALQKELMDKEHQERQGSSDGKSDDDEQEQAPVCDTEVVVEYVGPDVVDLVLVDLPGLIQSGPGVGRVEAMARRYIKHESTLIVIIREADLDQERAAAVKLAAETDPRQERTLQVLTKCDSFSKAEGEEEVVRLVTGQSEDCANDTSLAIHLTCCDPEGLSEEEYFKVHTFQDYSNVGSRDLAVRRLPHLLAQRISGCKPALLRQIRTKQEEARGVLQETGRSPKSNDTICLEFAGHVYEAIDMEEILTPTLARFEDVRITEEWTNAKHVPNEFVPSFYQGLSSFRRCVKDASEEFIHPRAQDVCNDVAALLDSIPGKVFQRYSLASSHLRQAFDAAWKTAADSIVQSLRAKVSDKVDAECRFATTNDHYLQAEYLQQLFTPDSVAQGLAQAVQAEHVAEFNRQGELSHLRDGGSRARALQPVFEAILQAHFTVLVKAEAKEFQKKKLHAAVKSYWKVTRKRVSDTIMQCVRDVVIKDGWETFHRGLPGVEAIKKSCEESDTTRKRREHNIKLENDMGECLKRAQVL